MINNHLLPNTTTAAAVHHHGRPSWVPLYTMVVLMNGSVVDELVVLMMYGSVVSELVVHHLQLPSWTSPSPSLTINHLHLHFHLRRLHRLPSSSSSF
ncbi:hypothetical protein HanXRQr2_Chr10g0442981 [Helianthus annuus]|uniref:Uncharacterized protein n=1 Tax=Helianthus annuus TaxID=4232 RepID=A0A9K3HXN7_HELAN|nr:hypothetical protein HanXRQr2_Chr10g0442981 [Helianthus annuus]